VAPDCALDSDPKSCTVRLTVQRSHSGSIDAAFSEGGENKAYQLRAQSFTSLP